MLVCANWCVCVVACCFWGVDEYGLISGSCVGRRVTQNMKRKHDDINHIQKVSVRCLCSFFVSTGHAISVISMIMHEAS